MCTPLISFNTVREIMTSWMTQYTEEWDNDGSRWKYESYAYDFSWYKYPVATLEGLLIGASLSDEGITIWTGVSDNDNIIISKDDIIFNDHSDFDEGFEHGKMYWLYTKLKYHDNSEEAEKITNECLEKESKCTGIVINQVPGIKIKQKFDTDYFEICNAYAIYDKACACRHGLLANMDENLLTFRIYSSANNSYQLDIKIDEFLNGVYIIKPLTVSEQ